MRNPFFASLATGIYGINDVRVTDLLKSAGMNTGNFLFTAAIHRVLRNKRLKYGFQFDPDKVREQHDCIVIPAANWLSVRTDWGDLAERIDATNLPCIIVGLGAQSQSSKQVPTLSDGTLRLVKLVSERSRLISVRGEYSASVLENYGIRNVEITGCPSLLWSLGETIQINKRAKQVQNVALHSTRALYDERIFLNNTRSRMSLCISRMANRLEIDYVSQSELPDMYFALNRLHNVGIYRKSIEFLSRLYDEKNHKKLRRYLTKHAKVFFNVDDWVNYMRGKDLSIGTRLHGTIASLLAGTPALLITHDTRTRETAEFMNIPCMDVDDISMIDDLDFQMIYDTLNFDKFNKSYQSYIDRFAKFFEANSLEHKLDKKN